MSRWQSPGKQFRQALENRTEPLMIPGVFNALVAKLAERMGFPAVYQSGAALSAGLTALPDIGLLTQTEFARQGGYLVQAVKIPVLSDADTGFGEPLSVERTVREFERAGLAGLHLEDQRLPKRCGHLSGKTLVSTEEMVAKIQAAVAARRDPEFVIIARTDARAVDGMSAALERSRAYLAAGADMIFPEALETKEEFAEVATALSCPLLANMTEFGKSPLLTISELGELGFAAVIYPVTFLRVAMHAVEQAMNSLRNDGTQQSLLEAMQTRTELYDLLDYHGYDERDQSYFGTGDES